MTQQPTNNRSDIQTGLDTESIINLMTTAYRQGLKAGHMSPEMKDNAQFAEDAAALFAHGLRDMLHGSAWAPAL